MSHITDISWEACGDHSKPSDTPCSQGCYCAPRQNQLSQSGDMVPLPSIEATGCACNPPMSRPMVFFALGIGVFGGRSLAGRTANGVAM